MDDLEVERVRERLRGIAYPGFSRDIVGAGFVGEIVANGKAVEIELKPSTRDEGKVVPKVIEKLSNRYHLSIMSM